MRFRSIAVIAMTGSIALVTLEIVRDVPNSVWHSADGRIYETTGSVDPIGPPRLSLSDEQRERIHGSLVGFPDALSRNAQEAALADQLSSDEPTQDLPERLTQEIPLLHAYKFVKLNDRILLIDPASRVVVAMIPRYRLLP
jgi:hypothetical protein